MPDYLSKTLNYTNDSQSFWFHYTTEFCKLIWSSTRCLFALEVDGSAVWSDGLVWDRTIKGSVWSPFGFLTTKNHRWKLHLYIECNRNYTMGRKENGGTWESVRISYRRRKDCRGSWPASWPEKSKTRERKRKGRQLCNTLYHYFSVQDGFPMTVVGFPLSTIVKVPKGMSSPSKLYIKNSNQLNKRIMYLRDVK